MTPNYGNLLLLAWAAGLRTRVDCWGPPPLKKMTKADIRISRDEKLIGVFNFPTVIGIRDTKVSNAKVFIEVPLKITRIDEPSFLETRRFADPSREQSENVFGGYRL